MQVIQKLQEKKNNFQSRIQMSIQALVKIKPTMHQVIKGTLSLHRHRPFAKYIYIKELNLKRNKTIT